MASKKICFWMSLRTGTFFLLSINLIWEVYEMVSSFMKISSIDDDPMLNFYYMDFACGVLGSLILLAAFIALIKNKYSICTLRAVMAFMLMEILYKICVKSFTFSNNAALLMLIIFVYLAFNLYSVSVFYNYKSELKRSNVQGTAATNIISTS